MHLYYKNVNAAYQDLKTYFKNWQDLPDFFAATPSRNGLVVRAKEPVTITYCRPWERVLVDPVRDCNPFFHLYEALWMLNGNNDVESLTQFLPRMKDFSDDGKTFHGAYGYRWRNYFGYDQLEWIIDELKANPISRRCVLQMWDGGRTDPEYDFNPPYVPEAIDGTGDLYMATHGGKDIPCNLCVVFEIVDKVLNMTVYNRSNDAILGSLGANYVHFTILQEYVASRIGVEMGRYHQISNNLHVYQDKQWEKLAATSPYRYDDPYAGNKYRRVNLIASDTFNDLLPKIVNDPFSTSIDYLGKSRFLTMANIIFKAFACHKKRDYEKALNYCLDIEDDAWKHDCIRWLNKRDEMYEKKRLKESSGSEASE